MGVSAWDPPWLRHGGQATSPWQAPVRPKGCRQYPPTCWFADLQVLSRSVSSILQQNAGVCFSSGWSCVGGVSEEGPVKLCEARDSEASRQTFRSLRSGPPRSGHLREFAPDGRPPLQDVVLDGSGALPHMPLIKHVFGSGVGSMVLLRCAHAEF